MIIQEIVWSNLIPYIGAITSIVMVISTIIYVNSTKKLVKETRLARTQMLEPHIIAYLDSAETNAYNTFIHIKNIGPGLAKNVKFKIIKDLVYDDAIKLEEIEVIKSGIKTFPSQFEIVQFLTNIMTDKNKKSDYIEFIITYSDVLEKDYEEHLKINLIELMRGYTLDPPESYIGRIAHSLINIEKKLK